MNQDSTVTINRAQHDKKNSAEWEIAETWSKFLYPFLFTHRLKPHIHSCGQDFAEALVADPKHPDVWVETAFQPRELENMLPYVKEYLQLPTNHQRFEMSSASVDPNALFVFSSHSGRPLAFHITDIVLHVFFNGVACLAIDVRPVAEPPSSLTIEDVEWVNAQLASLVRDTPFQLVDQDNWARHPNHFSIANICRERQQLTMRELIDDLLASFYSPDSLLMLTPMADRFLPIYGALLLRPSDRANTETLDEQFFEFAQHHLTILRKTFTPNNISTFSQIHLEDSSHHYMPYHNVIHSQSLDGGFILAYDNGLHHFSGSPARAMESFRTSYFYMMLIPFHQRLSILRYAMAAAHAGLSRERGAELRKLREEIYDFTSRCYFSQASVSEERNHIYQRWQHEFHVVRMYNDLKEEVHDIDNYLADLERERENELRDKAVRRDSRNMQLFGLVTLIFLPVTLLLYAIPDIPILNRWINFSQFPMGSLAVVLGMVAFVITLLLAIFRYLRRGRRTLDRFK